MSPVYFSKSKEWLLDFNLCVSVESYFCSQVYLTDLDTRYLVGDMLGIGIVEESRIWGEEHCGGAEKFKVELKTDKYKC